MYIEKMSDIKLRSQHVKMLMGKHKTVRDRDDSADITDSPQQFLKLREVFLQVANTTAGSFQLAVIEPGTVLVAVLLAKKLHHDVEVLTVKLSLMICLLQFLGKTVNKILHVAILLLKIGNIGLALLVVLLELRDEGVLLLDNLP